VVDSTVFLLEAIGGALLLTLAGAAVGTALVREVVCVSVDLLGPALLEDTAATVLLPTGSATLALLPRSLGLLGPAWLDTVVVAGLVVDGIVFRELVAASTVLLDSILLELAIFGIVVTLLVEDIGCRLAALLDDATAEIFVAGAAGAFVTFVTLAVAGSTFVLLFAGVLRVAT